MRGLLFLVVLGATVSALWIVMPMLQGGRDQDFEGKLVGALRFVEEEIEASSPAIVAADAFYVPVMEPGVRPNVWTLDGIAAVKERDGTVTNRQYVATVANLCRTYLDRACWRLDGLSLGARVAAERESAMAGREAPAGQIVPAPPHQTSVAISQTPQPGKVKVPKTASSTHPAAPAAEAAGTKAAEAAGTKAAEAAGTKAAEAAGTEAAEAAGTEVAEAAGTEVAEIVVPERPSAPVPSPETGSSRLAPPPATAAGVSPSSGVAAWTRSDEGIVLLIQRRLKVLGFSPGPLDGIAGPRTDSAIEAYQREHGLAVDGKPSRALLGHLGYRLLGQSPPDQRRADAQPAQGPGVVASRETRRPGPKGTGARPGRTSTTASAERPSPASGKNGAAKRPAATTLAPRGAAASSVDGTHGGQSLVFLIKSRLKELGLDPGPLDGDLGPRARASIEEFQRTYRLAVDGQPSKDLLGQLDRVVLSQSRTGRGVPGAGSLGKATASGYDEFQKGFEAADGGNQGLAIDFYTRAIEAGDLSREHLAFAFNNRGSSYRENGFYDRALDDFGNAIRLEPGYATAYHNRGLAYHEKGLYDRAVGDFDYAVRLKPGYAAAYYSRGLAYHEMGRYDRASDDYSKAIQLQPDLDYAYFNRGGIYEAKGHQQSALRDFQRAYSLKPGDPSYQAKMKELGLLQ